MSLQVYSTLPGKCVNSQSCIIQWKSIRIQFTFRVLDCFLLDSYTPLPITWEHSILSHLATGIAFFSNFQRMKVSLPASLSTAVSHIVWVQSLKPNFCFSFLSWVRSGPCLSEMGVVTTQKQEWWRDLPLSFLHHYCNSPQWLFSSSSLPIHFNFSNTQAPIVHARTYPVPWMTYLNWLMWT